MKHKAETVSGHVPAEVAESLRGVARRHDRSLSWVVANILKFHIESESAQELRDSMEVLGRSDRSRARGGRGEEAGS